MLQEEYSGQPIIIGIHISATYLNPAVVKMKTYVAKSPDAHTHVIDFNNRKFVARE
jgi:hypothetical protein